MDYPLLNKINDPSNLRAFAKQELPLLVKELREFIQNETSTKAGHIKSSLGVVELSIALHYHFNTPKDILIWDVGHQAYAHKVLTGRREVFHTNRQKGGIAGFTQRAESDYDPFGAGHSSTSVSALAGFIKAADLENISRKHIAVIGDGAITGGEAFEGLNFIGEGQSDCLIVFNDNQSSIDPNVGALQARRSYQAWVESMGFHYRYCDNGNDVNCLLDCLDQLDGIDGPKFFHIHTLKALGYKEDKQRKSAPAAPSFQSVFGEEILFHLQNDPKLVVLSPAMLGGANLLEAKQRFPDRVIDVGIAEQHVVTMAAGMAASGLKPLVHLYSTFAQRAIDQIIHDVALQKLGVVFVLDRAGYVGEDGPTHHGVYDQSLLADIPNIRIAAPAGAKALRETLNWALQDPQEAIFIRYPKASCDPDSDQYWQSYRPHWWNGSSKRKVLISTGTQATLAQRAAAEMAWGHLHVPIYRPFPEGDLIELLKEAQDVILIDENPLAGSLLPLLQDKLSIPSLRSILLPLAFTEHASREEQLKQAGFEQKKLLSMMSR